METSLIQALISLFSAIITTIGMIWAAVIAAQAKGSPPALPHDHTTTTTATPMSAVLPTHNQTARSRRSLLALVFILWGQLNIATGQWLDGGVALSAWSLSLIGQGLVMLLLGFWLLLRD